jgi:hypothetical protein
MEEAIMSIELIELVNPQEMEVHVNGPNGANRLFIYSGTAVFSFRGDSEDRWERNTLTFHVGRRFNPGEVIRAIAVGGLASIFNKNVANNAGWACDGIDADWDDESGHVSVRANLAVRDTDGYLLRIGYQVTVLAKLDSKSPEDSTLN